MSKISDAIKKFAPTGEDVIVLSIFKDQIKWMTAVYADASRGLLVKEIQNIPVAITAQDRYVGYWDAEDNLGYLLSGRGIAEPIDFINTIDELLKK